MWQWLLTAAGLAALLYNTFRVFQEYERAVIFRLGKFVKVKGPGLVLLIPFIDRAVKADLRIQTEDIPPQDVITRDSVSITVNAVLYRRVIDPELSVLAVEDAPFATSQASQTALRSALGAADLDAVLTEQERLADDIQAIISEQASGWGIQILSVEMKDVILPEDMKRVLARRAEAERERRAKVIHAEGELSAAERLSQSAQILSQEPFALHLRFLQSLSEVASENNETTVVPLPTELARLLMKR
ncbi:MAG: SPFH domain-containing protein [Candidatus Poribacteria bacterium]|nr:SPFH domain-containing protein [Candidatus Poribacteria bacterium]